MTTRKSKPTAKVWLEYNGEPVVGQGGAIILEAVKEKKSISEAARTTGMSYRYVWSRLALMRKALGEPVVETFRGGKAFGGARLTQAGENILKEYRLVQSYLIEVLDDLEYWEAAGLKISARNRLKGVVKSVEKGEIVSKVKIEISLPATVTAVISTEAVEALGVKLGDNVEAVIKATEVMVAKEE